jgi:hypothetical protein
MYRAKSEGRMRIRLADKNATPGDLAPVRDR